MGEHNLKEGIILTEDQEEIKVVEGKVIKVSPIWKWLLKSDKNSR